VLYFLRTLGILLCFLLPWVGFDVFLVIALALAFGVIVILAQPVGFSRLLFHAVTELSKSFMARPPGEDHDHAEAYANVKGNANGTCR
jgi:hypothetical protein